ncbi:IS91 family transposase [Pseudoflavonifractor sp. 524-17]|uniref:IS91 family transposase n=1 Tax=Pseudoflavonifractor sp. 524-17 TaxID=2304577 RepID=UPI00137A9BB4|nr:IS91 family transposase [Pseudoflavonifractor sp. 524-17]NCE66526.1 IS91 family transposase [Pseudoflavonifractor sp. 524-17]
MSVEIQNIFAEHIGAYAQSHRMNYNQRKAVQDIINCRTATLGAHIDTCDNCGYMRISYNSCRNRHCPKCQTFAKEKWIDKQRKNLLNTPYFHVVFTVPSELNPVFRYRQSTMYALLFQAASETVLELCADRKYLGAMPGITAILHTWGQNLQFHPHIHMIVTGGGLTPDQKWQVSSKHFFLPVRVLSAKFRGKFLALLKARFPTIDKSLLDICYQKKWVVYCKPPFDNAGKVISYLGRYTHRVAISNDRILSMGNGKVTFRWRDYAHGNQKKRMTLDAEEFIRRFLLHILPAGFRKIRHYGLFAARSKEKRLALCRRLTDTPQPSQELPPMALLERMLGKDFNLCPCCRLGHFSREPPCFSEC